MKRHEILAFICQIPESIAQPKPDNNIPRGMGKTKQSDLAISIGKNSKSMWSALYVE